MCRYKWRSYFTVGHNFLSRYTFYTRSRDATKSILFIKNVDLMVAMKTDIQCRSPLKYIKTHCSVLIRSFIKGIQILRHGEPVDSLYTFQVTLFNDLLKFSVLIVPYQCSHRSGAIGLPSVCPLKPGSCVNLKLFQLG